MTSQIVKTVNKKSFQLGDDDGDMTKLSWER